MNKNLKKLLLAGILLYAIGMGIGFANLKNSQSQTPTTTFRLVETAVKVTTQVCFEDEDCWNCLTMGNKLCASIIPVFQDSVYGNEIYQQVIVEFGGR